MRVFTSADHSVQVAAGEEFEVKLVAMTFGGYQWKVFPDTNLVEVVDDTKYTEFAASDLIGCPLWQWIRLKALGSGTTQLSFQHVRPWETIAPDDTHDVELTIR